MSRSTAIAEAAERPHAASPRRAVPFKSPSYPLRIHFAERAEYEERLRSIEERLQAVRSQLDAMGAGPDRSRAERLYVRIMGARDQVAETVRRLPLETGDLYLEDKERYIEAVAAFERADRCWQERGA